MQGGEIWKLGSKTDRVLKVAYLSGGAMLWQRMHRMVIVYPCWISGQQHCVYCLQSSYKVECTRYNFKISTKTKPYCAIAYHHSKGLLRANRLIDYDVKCKSIDWWKSNGVLRVHRFNIRCNSECSCRLCWEFQWKEDNALWQSLHLWLGQKKCIVGLLTPHTSGLLSIAALRNQKSNTFLYHLNDIRPTMHWEPHAIKVARVVWRLWLLACHRSSR